MEYCITLQLVYASIYGNFNGRETGLGESAQSQAYINDKQTRKGIIFDKSKIKIGKQSFPNRLHIFSEITFDKIGAYGDDYIRQHFKRLLLSSTKSYLFIANSF